MSLVVRWLVVLAVAGLLVGNAVACPLWTSSLDATSAKGCCQHSGGSKDCPATICQMEAPYVLADRVSPPSPHATTVELPAVISLCALLSAGPVMTRTILPRGQIAQHSSEPLFLQIRVLLI
jgi:hypothetical protein